MKSNKCTTENNNNYSAITNKNDNNSTYMAPEMQPLSVSHNISVNIKTMLNRWESVSHCALDQSDRIMTKDTKKALVNIDKISNLEHDEFESSIGADIQTNMVVNDYSITIKLKVP